MASKGVGARIRWTIESKQVLADLERIFGTASIERLDFERGEQLRLAAIEAYKRAKHEGRLVTKKFSSAADISREVRQVLSSVKSDSIAVFLQNSEARGVYRTASSRLQQHAMDTLNYDGSSVYFVAIEGNEGIVLDCEEIDTKGKQYELEYWSVEAP